MSDTPSPTTVYGVPLSALVAAATVGGALPHGAELTAATVPSTQAVT